MLKQLLKSWIFKRLLKKKKKITPNHCGGYLPKHRGDLMAQVPMKAQAK